MADLDRALVEIRAIRRHVAETTEFRGYGPLTLSVTAFLAVVAGIVQWLWLPDAAAHPAYYVGLWVTTAVLSAALIATQMLTRADRLHSHMAREMVQAAVTQFLPAAAAGSLLPFILLHLPRSSFWMLPALWQIITSLGTFASCRCLPRSMLLAGAWFFTTGFLTMLLGGERALAPICMAGPYSVGMALVALLHLQAGRNRVSDEAEEL